MNELVAVALPGGPEFVDALRRSWDDGDAVFPVDLRLPAPARSQVLAAMAPAWIADESGRHRAGDGRPVEAGDALVVATSGTSGRPKGVVLTHDAVAASARATSARIGVRPDDHWLACLPLAHVGGLSVVTRALVLGTPLTVLPGFDVDAVRRSPATLVSLVATALARIDPARFRVIVLGGAAPPPDLPPNCVTTYGMTETGSGVLYDGVPLDVVDVRVDDDGQVLLRGPMLLRAYRDGTDPKDADGWLATGDLGEWVPAGDPHRPPTTTSGHELVNEERPRTAPGPRVGGYEPGWRLVVHGRRGDLVITGGENVWPDAVERALAGAPGVVDVGIAGRPDPEWGQRVVAFVVPADPGDPPTLDALRSWVKQTLPAYCAPRELVLVDAVPRTALGKIQRHRMAGVEP